MDKNQFFINEINISQYVISFDGEKLKLTWDFPSEKPYKSLVKQCFNDSTEDLILTDSKKILGIVEPHRFHFNQETLTVYIMPYSVNTKKFNKIHKN